MLLLLHITCLCVFHAYVPSISLYFHILICVGAFLLVSLSLSLSLSLYALACSMTSKRKSTPSKTLFVPRHPLLILLHLTFSSIMRRPSWTSWRISHDEAFIWNATLFYQTFPILTFPLSSTVGVRSYCVMSWSLVSL